MNHYHRSNASTPSPKGAHEGPLTIEERSEVIDRLASGAAPRAALVRKLLRLHDEQRAELNSLKVDNDKPVSSV